MKILFGLGCMININKTIMLLIMTWLLARNENRTHGCQPIVLDLPNCISICSHNNPNTILYHSLFLFSLASTIEYENV